MAEVRYFVKDPLFKKDDGFETLDQARRNAMRLLGFYRSNFIPVYDIRTGSSCGVVEKTHYGTMSKTGAYRRYDVFVWRPSKFKTYLGSMDPNIKILNRDGSIRESLYKSGSGRVF